MPNIYFRFSLYIVLFSMIVSLGTSLINYNVQYRNLDRDILAKSETLAESIRGTLDFDIQHVEEDIFAMINNPLFRRYLNNPDTAHTAHAVELLFSHSEANRSYFQVRFLDAQGVERIRIEKDRLTGESLVVPVSALQDKSHRYYFRETMAMPAGQTWRSRLDLNIEHHQIEQPIRPTLRIAAPVFHAGQAAGILIINADMSGTLSLIIRTPDFRVYLIDGEGYFLKHPDESLSWSRYLDGTARAQTTWPALADRLLSQDNVHTEPLHAFSLDDEIRNGEQIRLLLEAQERYVNALKRHNLKLALYLALMILAIAIPVGLLLAVRPARVQKALRDALEQNARQLGIIDKYVLTFGADRNGEIKAISQALRKLSGFSHDEVIGQPLHAFIDARSSAEFFGHTGANIHGGLVWQGEIKGRSKTGDTLWLDATVLPEYAEDRVIGINVICIDVTDKKRIARLSEEDHLTGIYNRIKLDSVLLAESARVQRYQTRFSGILLDIDHFKAVNDQYGHLVGDEVLKTLARILQSHTRATDVVGRWGGEEFMVLCLETPLQGAQELAEKLRASFQQHEFEQLPSQTASFGVTEFTTHDTLSSFIKRMDDALYAAKDGGRNQVVSSQAQGGEP